MGQAPHVPNEPSRRDGVVRWWWAVAPSPALAVVARTLERGEVPPGAVPIKDGERRAVWSLRDVAGGLLLKRFAVRRGERLKYALQASRARREYLAMEAFVRLGLPVVRPLGCGERRQGTALREAWFVGRLVPDAITLDAAVDRCRRRGDAAGVRSLAEAALALTAELHAHPWLHRDLHSGNLLLDARGRLLVTDLHSVWRVPRLTRRMRLANLARLLYSLRTGLDLREAPALLAGYAALAGEPPDALVLDALAALAAFERTYVAGRVRRCVQSSTLFDVGRTPEGRMFRRRDYTLDQLRADLDEHARVLAEGGPRVLGLAPRGRVTRVGDGATARVVKDYVPGGRLTALRQSAGQGRGRTAWIGARRLEVLGVPTPEALALLERRDGTAVLVTRNLHEARSLRDAAAALAADRRSAARAAVARGAGHLVGRLARAGLRHADLSSKNVWIAPAPEPPLRDLRDVPPPGTTTLQLIDLDGLRPMPAFDARGLTRMLGQLADLPVAPSRTDLRRFARAFAEAAGRELPREVAADALAEAARRAASRAAALDPARRAP